MLRKRPAFGRLGFDPYTMFATILYGFAVGSPTLRELENSCRYNLRFKYLMNEATPDHSSFSRFINQYIKPNADAFFSCVVQAYLKRCNPFTYWRAPEGLQPETFKSPLPNGSLIGSWQRENESGNLTKLLEIRTDANEENKQKCEGVLPEPRSDFATPPFCCRASGPTLFSDASQAP